MGYKPVRSYLGFQFAASFFTENFTNHTLCFPFSYSAAAVITSEDGLDDIPYLDKFTVGRNSQVQSL